MADLYHAITFLTSRELLQELAEVPEGVFSKIEGFRENGRDKLFLVTFGDDAAEIATFTVPGATGEPVIDSEAGTVEIEIGDDPGDPSALVATFTLSVDARGAKVSGEFVVSETTAIDYTDPVVFEVIAENGTRKYWTVTVTIEE